MKQGEKDVMTKKEILQGEYHNICIIIVKGNQLVKMGMWVKTLINIEGTRKKGQLLLCHTTAYFRYVSCEFVEISN